MVRSFAEEVLAPTCLERDRTATPPLEEWKAFCESGLQGITIPEEFGGNPVDDISEAIIVEELNSAQGVAMDIAGYYSPNFDLASKAMRPSATLNAALAAV